MKIFMRGHKQDYFILILAGVLLFIVFLIVYISFTQYPAPAIKPTSPTIIPTEVQTSPLPVQYDYSAQDRLAKIITTRPAISSTDSEQKTNMLNTILHGFNSGVLYENTDVRIEYVQSADLFTAEIKTVNIVKAKADATTWFLNQGISQKGLCDLPVMFFLDPQVTQQLQGQDVIFSPLPNSC
jgi:hypothetical protein